VLHGNATTESRIYMANENGEKKEYKRKNRRKRENRIFNEMKERTPT